MSIRDEFKSTDRKHYAYIEGNVFVYGKNKEHNFLLSKIRYFNVYSRAGSQASGIYDGERLVINEKEILLNSHHYLITDMGSFIMELLRNHFKD